MHQYKLLKEIRERAFKSYIFDPLNEEARNLFVETNQLYLTTERNEEDDDSFGLSNDYDNEETSGFDIFGDDDDDDSDNTNKQAAFRKVKLTQRNPIDPPFGLKAALCFDSVNDYENSVLKAIQDIQAGGVENILAKAGTYQPFIRDKMNIAKKKYDDALSDVNSIRMSGTSMAPRKELTFDSFLADELGNITKSDLPSDLRKKFLPKGEGNLGKFISRDQVGATVTGIGAGELEFLARMFFMSVGGHNPDVSSKIKVGENNDRRSISEQETQLLKLAPRTVGYNCLRTLRDYLSHAVKEALQPVAMEIHLDEFMERGIDQVLDGIAKGQYNFAEANIATWAFQVMKNKAKDLLKNIVDYDYDDSNAAKWVSTMSFPLSVYSKANPQAALSLKSKDILHFSSVDTEKKFNIKGETDKFFKYVYDSEYDFFEDLRASNGYYKDAEMGQKDTAGRKKQYLEASPLYYQNLSLQQRKNFMTSLAKGRFANTDDFPEISTAQVPVLDQKGREAKALEVAKDMQNYLNDIVNDIYEKIISSSAAENKYSQKSIVSYMKYNPDLTKKLIKGLLNFGVYKFQRDHYNFITNPEGHLSEFFNDVYKSEFPTSNVPSMISNGKSEIPVYEKGFKGTQFLQDLRRVILGRGTAGWEVAPLALKGGEESDTEFRDKVLAGQKSGGFLIQHPDYLRNIYKTLSKMSAKDVVGRANPKGIDESVKGVKSLINEIRKDFTTYKNQITKNFIQSWN